MTPNNAYDVAVIGGGLAGLASSILLAHKGFSVVLFEKKSYPFHKVCGEYVSMESHSFLCSLGVPLHEMRLPVIDRLLLSSPSGKTFGTMLPLGGFGISRYRLDACLFEIARQNGVSIFENTRVIDVEFDDSFRLKSSAGEVSAAVCCGAFGKRSNLDVKWKRSFLQKQNKLTNYVGIKYHVNLNWQPNVIGLHNFKDGYCGISKIEDDRFCLCYLTTAKNLKNAGNNIRQLEESVLQKNPHLKKIFSEARTYEGFPEAISQISFKKKTPVENHVLMLGDAAGMITPLCGNGMSIALHTAAIAAPLITAFLKKEITRLTMEKMYQEQWHAQFSKRLATGRTLQRFFGREGLSNLFVGTFNAFPFMAAPLIKMTHGKPF